MKKLQLPFGVQDYAKEECYNKNIIENKLGKLFYSAGFDRVETASLEYYELFDDAINKNSLNRMFKLTDSDGSLLVLRPDITLQICRMAAKSTELKPLKLYYIENSYEFLSDNSTARTREFAQIGLEILGSERDTLADIEAVILAIQSLKQAGLESFLIDIGDVSYFNGLLRETKLTFNEATELRNYLEKKDIVAGENLLKNKNVSPKICEAFLQLPTLFGDADTLKRAEKLCVNDECTKAVRNLKAIINAVDKCGYSRYVSIDFGMLKGGYYSGLVIKGFAEGLGVSVLDGGRYDNLCQKFGKKMGAVGFTIGTKRLLKALEHKNLLSELAPCEYAYIINDDAFKQAMDEVELLTSSKKRAIRVYCKTENELINYCKLQNIPIAIVFDKNGTKRLKVEVKG